MVVKEATVARVCDIVHQRLIALGKLGHLLHIVGNLLPVVDMDLIQVLTVALLAFPDEHGQLIDNLFILVCL